MSIATALRVTLFPYTTLFRSADRAVDGAEAVTHPRADQVALRLRSDPILRRPRVPRTHPRGPRVRPRRAGSRRDRKSTRLNSTHGYISYALFYAINNNQA